MGRYYRKKMGSNLTRRGRRLRAARLVQMQRLESQGADLMHGRRQWGGRKRLPSPPPEFNFSPGMKTYGRQGPSNPSNAVALVPRTRNIGEVERQIAQLFEESREGESEIRGLEEFSSVAMSNGSWQNTLIDKIEALTDQRRLLDAVREEVRQLHILFQKHEKRFPSEAQPVNQLPDPAVDPDCVEELSTNAIEDVTIKVEPEDFDEVEPCSSGYGEDDMGHTAAEMEYLKEKGWFKSTAYIRKRRFACKFPGCKLRFKVMWKLKKHLLEHPDFFQCVGKGCGQTFTFPTSYQHFLDHHCTPCPSSEDGDEDAEDGAEQGDTFFVFEGSLNKRPWKCTVEGCPKRFFHKCRVLQHITKNHKRLAYECNAEGCAQGFVSEELLREHRQTHRID